MALLIERLPARHIGYHCGKPSDPAGTVRQLNLGWIAFIHFHGSLVDLLQRWQRVADNSVREQVAARLAAETIGVRGGGR